MLPTQVEQIDGGAVAVCHHLHRSVPLARRCIVPLHNGAVHCLSAGLKLRIGDFDLLAILEPLDQVYDIGRLLSHEAQDR